MDRRIFVAVIVSVAGLMSCSVAGRSAVMAAEGEHVSMRDFFAYACVREYTTAHSFAEFDSSVAYGVEYSRVSAEVLGRVYEAAKAFAVTLPAPDLEDEEHGGVPVVAACLEKSRDPTLATVVDENAR